MRTLWPRSIRRGLLLLTLGAVLPGIAVLLYTFQALQENVAEDVRGYALRQVLAMAAHHERVLDNARLLLRTLSKTEEFRRLDAAACRTLLEEVLSLYPAYVSMALGDQEGRVVAQAPPGGSSAMGQEPYFRQAMQSGQFAASPYRPRPDHKGVVIHLAQPIVDQAGGARGVLVAVFDLNYLMTVFADSHLPELSVLTMTDSDGMRLTRFPETEKYTWVPDLPRMIQRMSGPQEEGTFLETGVDQVRRLYSFKRQALAAGPGSYLMFRLGIPVEHALARARSLLIGNLILLGLTALGALALAWLLGEFLVLRPLSHLVDSAQRLGGGDLTARTGLSHGAGELGRLAQAFDAMAASLQKRDLQNRQAQEEIEGLLHEKLECLDRLARCVAHELRNPVATIGGLAARMLKQTEGSSSNADYLRKIILDAGRLERIVKEVREYADLPIPTLKVQDLGALVGKAAREVGEHARSRGVKMAMQGAAGREGEVLAWVDGGMVQKALRLLLDNALEAMPQGGQLILSLASQGGKAAISVTDTGRGIAGEDIPFLFDPFFTTKADAVGISLSMVKRIANDHGGEVEVTSQLGQGSTFTLSLPLGLEEAAHQTSPS